MRLTVRITLSVAIAISFLCIVPEAMATGTRSGLLGCFVWAVIALPLIWYMFLRQEPEPWQKGKSRRKTIKPVKINTQTVTIPCFECKGSNICPDCKGEGLVSRTVQNEIVLETCRACNGSGVCYRCHGRGYEKRD